YNWAIQKGIVIGRVGQLRCCDVHTEFHHDAVACFPFPPDGYKRARLFRYRMRNPVYHNRQFIFTYPCGVTELEGKYSGLRWIDDQAGPPLFWKTGMLHDLNTLRLPIQIRGDE